MELIELKLVNLVPANGPQFVVILREEKDSRHLPIIIGLPEAQAIAMELDKVPHSRPMTHDLFVNTLSAFGIDLVEIIITKFDQDGIFHSELVCQQAGTNTKIRIDSRTSDAIALALRFKCKIYTYETILSKAAFIVDKKLSHSNEIKTLEDRLQKAIETENYELAAKLKKELTELKKKL